MTIFTAKKQARYSSIRRRRRFRSVSSRINVPHIPEAKYILLGIISIVVFILGVFLVLKVITSDYFRITKITTIGSQSIPKEQISHEIEPFIEKGIFLTNSNSIKNKLINTFPSYKFVTVKKIFPNELIINITEKQPILLYLNLNGIYLVNEDGVISEVILQDKINFANDQLDIITGAKGIDSKLVLERLKSEYQEKEAGLESEGEEIEFIYDNISQEEKFATLNTIQKELFEQAKTIIASHLEDFDETMYAELEKVYAFNNNVYKEGDFIDKDRLVVTREIEQFFSKENDKISEILWEGRFVVKVVTESGKVAIFGVKRNISEQIEDYLIITAQLQREERNFNEIDLSSRKVSVK